MKRTYINVTAEFSPEGAVTPVKMEYADRWYDIDRLVHVERLAPETGGGGMLRYTVKVWSNTRYLWREGDRRFVEIPS